MVSRHDLKISFGRLQVSSASEISLATHQLVGPVKRGDGELQWSARILTAKCLLALLGKSAQSDPIFLHWFCPWSPPGCIGSLGFAGGPPGREVQSKQVQAFACLHIVEPQFTIFADISSTTHHTLETVDALQGWWTIPRTSNHSLWLHDYNTYHGKV